MLSEDAWIAVADAAQQLTRGRGLGSGRKGNSQGSVREERGQVRGQGQGSER